GEAGAAGGGRPARGGGREPNRGGGGRGGRARQAPPRRCDAVGLRSRGPRGRQRDRLLVRSALRQDHRLRGRGGRDQPGGRNLGRRRRRRGRGLGILLLVLAAAEQPRKQARLSAGAPGGGGGGAAAR